MNKEEIKQLATNTANIKDIREDIILIRKQVTNDIPHQIKALDKRIDGIAIKISGVVAVIGILTQIAFKLL